MTNRSSRRGHHPDGHLQVLEALDGAGHVSQQAVAEAVGMAASRVNRIIRTLMETGRVKVVDSAVRPYAYTVTEDGRAYVRELSFDHYAAVVGRYRQVQHRIRERLREIRDQGIQRVVFYGAGEVMEVAHPLADGLGLCVVAVVDDDPARQGIRNGIEVVPPGEIAAAEAEAVVITTFQHAAEIGARLGDGLPSSLSVVEL